jgi:hypothetical protein
VFRTTIVYSIDDNWDRAEASRCQQRNGGSNRVSAVSAMTLDRDRRRCPIPAVLRLSPRTIATRP